MSHPVESVIVSLSDECLTDDTEFDAAVRACVSTGLIVKKRLQSIGVVSGSIERTRITTLKALECVASVEPDEQRFPRER